MLRQTGNEGAQPLEQQVDVIFPKRLAKEELQVLLAQIAERFGASVEYRVIVTELQAMRIQPGKQPDMWEHVQTIKIEGSLTTPDGQLTARFSDRGMQDYCGDADATVGSLRFYMAESQISRAILQRIREYE